MTLSPVWDTSESVGANLPFGIPQGGEQSRTADSPSILNRIRLAAADHYETGNSTDK